MADLEIIGIPLSNYVRSIRMLCEEKGVPYTLKPVPPHSPDVIAIHPAGQIPCLRHGDVALFESKARGKKVRIYFNMIRLLPVRCMDLT